MGLFKINGSRVEKNNVSKKDCDSFMQGKFKKLLTAQ